MFKSILSVVAGYAAWTVIFLGGSAAISSARADTLDVDGFSSDGTTLGLYLLVSVIASAVSGFVTAKLADRLKMRHAMILAGLLLATGIPVQLSAWDRLPVWYNLVFLVLLVPVTLAGARAANK